MSGCIVFLNHCFPKELTGELIKSEAEHAPDMSIHWNQTCGAQDAKVRGLQAGFENYFAGG